MASPPRSHHQPPKSTKMAAKATSHTPYPLAPTPTTKKAPTFAAMADSSTASSALRCSSFSAFGADRGGRRLVRTAPTSVSAGSRRRRRVLVVRAARWGEQEGDEGFYPWESGYGGDGGFEWVAEERITLFTTDGLLQIGGSLVPRRISSSEKKRGGKVSKRFLQFQEKDYMDPSQGLCLGALFDIAATNGLDMGRRLCIFGFCRSIEMLSDVVEETVLEHGGEVVATERASDGGLQEKLTMTVAVPLLWGVPPASETLRVAVKSGGGIVEKVYWKWDFF